MSATNLLIDLENMTIEEAMNTFVIAKPDGDFLKYSYAQKTGSQLKFYSNMLLRINHCISTYPAVPFPDMKRGPTGEFDAGFKRSNVRLRYPYHEVSKDPHTNYEVFTILDMACRGAFIHNAFRKECGNTEFGKLFEKRVLTFVIRKVESYYILDASDGSKEDGKNAWVIRAVYLDDEMQLQECEISMLASKLSSSTVPDQLSLFKQAVKPGIAKITKDFACEKQNFFISDKPITTYIMNGSCLSPSERPQKAKDSDKKKKAVDPTKKTHFINLEYTPSGVSLRGSTRPGTSDKNLTMVKDGVALDPNDETRPASDYGILAKLGKINKEGKLCPVAKIDRNSKSGKSSIDWFTMTRDVREIADLGANDRATCTVNKLECAQIWNECVKRSIGPDASHYPLPDIVRPSGKDTIWKRLIHAGAVFELLNIGYGSGALGTHYRIPNYEALYVLPFLNNGGGQSVLEFDDDDDFDPESVAVKKVGAEEFLAKKETVDLSGMTAASE